MQDIERQRRHSLRLRDWDYATDAAYYVTLCVQDRLCLFGEVVNGEIEPSIAGLVMESWWGNVTRRFPGVGLDAYVVMPNHFHGIVLIGAANTNGFEQAHTIVGADRCVRPATISASPPLQPQPSLSQIVQWFKSMTTNDYIRGVKEQGWPPFNKRMWQRNYHDHIVRNDRDLDRVRAYIDGNPSRWADDSENPAVTIAE